MMSLQGQACVTKVPRMGHCLSASKNRTLSSNINDDDIENEQQLRMAHMGRMGGNSSDATNLPESASKMAPHLLAKDPQKYLHLQQHQKLIKETDFGNNSTSNNSPKSEPKCGAGTMEKLVAIFSYESRSEGDLGFEKDDIMFLLDNSNPDWWYVRNAKGIAGYIPRNFVAFVKAPEAHPWFAGRIPRSVAERLVADRHLPPGTFLIRERESDNLEYALTIRDIDQGHGSCVKHYKIKRFDNNAGFYITTRMVFPSLEALVSYYSERPDGLCHNLVIPAPRMVPLRPDLCYETQQNWEIPRHELELVRKLGDGNFGEVWYGRWRGKVEVAVKTMKPGTMSSEAFLSEANIMKQCQHTNLVRLFAVCTHEEPFYIITEYMPNGSLLEYLRAEIKDGKGQSRPKNPLSMPAMVDICAQIANGMKYLEERKLVHRDLAARNVLVGEKISGVPVVKVADFGLARKLMEEDIYEAQTGAKFPIKWTAPEAATHGSFTVKSDVWSYGVLLYEIFTRGVIPYPGMHNREVIERVEMGERMSCPYSSDPEEQQLIRRIYEQVMLKCWEKLPDNRPTFETLYLYFDDFFISQQPNYNSP